jgi:hypothetical protein
VIAQHQPRFNLAALCRGGVALSEALRYPREQRLVLRVALQGILLGTLSYGAVMGLWRSPLQAAFSAVKMPLLFFSVVLASGVLNTMLAQLRGAGFSLREVCLYMLVGMGITAAILAALSPVALYFVLQVPPCRQGLDSLPAPASALAPAMHVFRRLLLLHVACIGLAGLLGNLRLYQLLRLRLPDRAMARQILAIWILVSGFVGCELSWLFSPFLCKPNFPAHVFARSYFEGNFYEHVYHAVREEL